MDLFGNMPGELLSDEDVDFILSGYYGEEPDYDIDPDESPNGDED